MGELADLADLDPARHVPVLVEEVLGGLGVEPGGAYLDGTVGGGGHAVAILERSSPKGRLLGLDRDPQAAARAARRLEPFGERAQVVHVSYRQMDEVARARGFAPLDGVLLDLGFSSFQIEDARRGFAFSLAGPLDMRFDPTEEVPTAADLVNRLPEEELAELLWEFGEERRSRRIARAIVAVRPLHTTEELAKVTEEAVGRQGRLHPATRTFQALRIAVNRELEGVRDALPRALSILRPGGRLAVITFHSLEDRIVKHFLREEASDCLCPPELPVCACGHEASVELVNRKPITPSEGEVERNPRSRSAKLRVAEKL